MPGTPMVGLNDERFGDRFFSLANAYDADYRAMLQTVAAKEGFPLHEGVFVSYPGPNFETAAEIRMMQIIGGDVVGMSVVPEVISARHCGLKVVAVSAITNLAEGLGEVNCRMSRRSRRLSSHARTSSILSAVFSAILPE
jgi:xanthosine phosphorylase